MRGAQVFGLTGRRFFYVLGRRGLLLSLAASRVDASGGRKFLGLAQRTRLRRKEKRALGSPLQPVRKALLCKARPGPIHFDLGGHCFENREESDPWRLEAGVRSLGRCNATKTGLGSLGRILNSAAGSCFAPSLLLISAGVSTFARQSIWPRKSRMCYLHCSESES